MVGAFQRAREEGQGALGAAIDPWPERSSMACREIGDYVFRAHVIRRCRDGAESKGGSIAMRYPDGAIGTLHDLRRTFATQLRSLGVDRLVVSKLLNHAEGGVTKIYDRYIADPEKAAAMERWANRLREIISGTHP